MGSTSAWASSPSVWDFLWHNHYVGTSMYSLEVAFPVFFFFRQSEIAVHLSSAVFAPPAPTPPAPTTPVAHTWHK